MAEAADQIRENGNMSNGGGRMDRTSPQQRAGPDGRHWAEHLCYVVAQGFNLLFPDDAIGCFVGFPAMLQRRLTSGQRAKAESG